MKRFLSAFGAIALMTGPASASDIYTPADAYQAGPAQAAADWTGPFIGVFGGSGWSERAVSLNDGFAAAVFAPGTAEIDAQAWLAGAVIGYDRQFGPIVIGAQADIGVTGIEGETLAGTPKFVATDGADGTAWGIAHQVDYLGTLRGRIGVAAGDLLIYGTGGAAWARVKETHSVQDGQNPAHAKSTIDVNHLGWAAGGGVEWKFKPGWTLSTEYLRIELDDADYAHDVGNKSGAPDLTSADMTIDIVRAGINYRF